MLLGVLYMQKVLVVDVAGSGTGIAAAAAAVFYCCCRCCCCCCFCLSYQYSELFLSLVSFAGARRWLCCCCCCCYFSRHTVRLSNFTLVAQNTTRTSPPCIQSNFVFVHIKRDVVVHQGVLHFIQMKNASIIALSVVQ